ncbi:hypothetical protein ICW40_13665 [Actinotalea ferrariae]|uniref:hypothetical protein n=1 Tax=Actinotalea ferrariae TaxID=1386098 RepID=UPI001C8B9E52|nr:hypothetical protein [Actinotalea ferrariae]MBX9245851.1 hypothetical protein [Actinotalea ferrariae]
MTGVTYADLITTAGQHVTTGALQVRQRPFDRADDARTALQDFHAVLDAIETHTRALIGPSRLAGISPTTRLEPVVDHALAMVDGLRDLVGADRPHPTSLQMSDRAWAQAALQLRGASDLLAVHLDAWGRQRSPDAAIIGDPAARDGALIRVAGHLDTLLAAESTLGLRSLQAGLRKVEVSRTLPGLDTNRSHAAHLTRHPGGAVSRALDGLRLVGEPVRTDDPVLHAGDLIHRLRQATWALRTHPDYSVATLSDLATAGLAIHAHTATARGANLTRNPPVRPEDTAALLSRAAAWRDLRTDLAEYQAPGPADPHIRADVLAVRDLLARIAPLDGSRQADPRTTGLLLAAIHATEEIATTAGEAFGWLAAAGHVRIQARHLTSDQLGTDPALISAHVTGTTTVAPPARWQITTHLWSAAAGHADLRYTPVEQAIAAAHQRTETAHVLTRTPLERSTP